MPLSSRMAVEGSLSTVPAQREPRFSILRETDHSRCTTRMEGSRRASLRRITPNDSRYWDRSTTRADMKSPPERIEDDPRLEIGVDYFNRGDFFEAGEEFEDLFFEAIRDEIDFIRVFLQVSVGIHHVERGQLNAAIERLEEALRVMGRVRDPRGWDFERLAGDVLGLIPAIQDRARGARTRIEWPKIHRVEAGVDRLTSRGRSE